MTRLEDQGTLKSLFELTKPDYVLHADMDGKRLANEKENHLQGLKSGSVEGIHASSAAATIAAQTKTQDEAERKAKQSADDMLFLQLLEAQIAQINTEINFHEEQITLLTQTASELASGDIDIEESLELDHVKRAISEWEQRTGQKFDPLEENAEAKLNAIINEQIQIDHNTVSGLKIRHNELVEQGRQIDENFKIDAEGAFNAADQKSSKAYVAARTIGNVTTTEVIQAQTRDNQDEFADVELGRETVISNEDGGFGALLETSTENARNEFKTAAALPETNTDAILTHSNTPKFDNMG